mmetsp:Transcript_2021/g.7539  ORF Transcript_2021/g.7539 Transcript_2021/m.7539 type:complete len:235 (-) Transcript_2021:80-784(-)
MTLLVSIDCSIAAEAEECRECNRRRLAEPASKMSSSPRTKPPTEPLALPKSHNLITRPPYLCFPSSVFALLISRCIMPTEWQYRTPSAACCINPRTSAADNCPRMPYTSPPSAYSKLRYTSIDTALSVIVRTSSFRAPLEALRVNASRSVHTFGCLDRCNATISRNTLRASCSDANAFGIRFSAVHTPSYLVSRAKATAPKDPSPSTSVTTYRAPTSHVSTAPALVDVAAFDRT